LDVGHEQLLGDVFLLSLERSSWCITAATITLLKTGGLLLQVNVILLAASTIQIKMFGCSGSLGSLVLLIRNESVFVVVKLID